MARIDSAYDYFISTYGKSIGSRYESHKKSELRETYNNIIKANKNAPLYRISQTSDLGKTAIDIKESANSISRAVSNLKSHGDDIESVLSKKIANSTDSDSVSANFVGNADDSNEPFEIEVQSLATPQINQGNFLNPQARNFEEGQYSFDLDIKSGSYEFQFNVNVDDTNNDVQNKIARLINNSGVGLDAKVISDEKGNTALSISSKATGLSSDEDKLFNIQSTSSFKELNLLGISEITYPATNSSFTLNGKEHSSLSNTFTVNNSYEITLKQPSSSPVTIGLMNDSDALAEGINQLLDGYNQMIETGKKYSMEHGNNTLLNEFSAISKRMEDDLKLCGITSDGFGTLSLDTDELSSAINSENKNSVFNTLSKLRDSIHSLAKRASINPINYVDKKIVEYKNPQKTLAFPYATSQYSGLIVDYGL